MRRMLIAVCGGLLIAFLIGFGINAGLAAAGAEPSPSAWAIAAVIGAFSGLGLMNAGGRRRAATADSPTRQAALDAPPAEGLAKLVVFREGMMGKRNGIDLRLDGRDIVQLISPQFTALQAAPGRHVIQAALAGGMNAASKPAQMDVDLSAGETAVIRVTLAMRMTTSDVVLTRMDDGGPVLTRLARTPMAIASPAPA